MLYVKLFSNFVKDYFFFLLFYVDDFLLIILNVFVFLIAAFKYWIILKLDVYDTNYMHSLFILITMFRMLVGAWLSCELKILPSIYYTILKMLMKMCQSMSMILINVKLAKVRKKQKKHFN